MGAIATAADLGTVHWLERQSQVLCFRLRGTVAPPDNIIILAIDQESLARGEDYQRDPTRYPELEPIQSFPWRRTAYAVAIDKLLAAGARSVSVDLLLVLPSAYEPADDQRLRQTLHQHQGRVVLASSYEISGTPEAGEQGQIITPNPVFQVLSVQQGLINFPQDADKRVYQLSEVFLNQLLHPQGLGADLSSFAIATLQAAKLPRPVPEGGNIYFYGPPTTFPRVSFWHVLDPTNWEVELKNQTFKDKIVLIGVLTDTAGDFVRTPFSETMPGSNLPHRIGGWGFR
jgi:adenylate cyclase